MDRSKQHEILEKISVYEKFGSVLGLSRIRKLMGLLGDPQKDLKVIHVAGTNGKGSVCRFITEAIRSCGYSVGLFTSPYITQWRERIQLDGEMISWEDLERSSRQVFAAADRMSDEGESPTEFEVVTAIALLYFREKAPDFVVLEVGLGGRGDSTNVIEESLISVITSIHRDHTDRLGGTLPEIAREKAGIIKEGCPVVVNVEDREALKVIAMEAYEKGAPLKDMSKVKVFIEPIGAADENIFEDPEGSLPLTRFSTEIGGIRYPGIEISMAGEHQVTNAVTALGAIEILRKKGIIKLDEERFKKAMKEAVQPARFEKIGPCILDGAHNPQAMEVLAGNVGRYFPHMKPVIVLGILADKESDRMMGTAVKMSDRIIVTRAGSHRDMRPEDMAAYLEAQGISPVICEDPCRALDMAMEETGRMEQGDGDAGKTADYILITGSLYLVSRLRQKAVDLTDRSRE